MKKLIITTLLSFLAISGAYAACSTDENACQENKKDLFSQSLNGTSLIEKMNKKLGFPMGGPGWLTGVNLSEAQESKVEGILKQPGNRDCTWSNSTTYYEKGFKLISSPNYSDAKAMEASKSQGPQAKACFESLKVEHQIYNVLTKTQQKQVESRQGTIVHLIKEINSPNLVIKN